MILQKKQKSKFWKIGPCTFNYLSSCLAGDWISGMHPEYTQWHNTRSVKVNGAKVKSLSQSTWSAEKAVKVLYPSK